MVLPNRFVSHEWIREQWEGQQEKSLQIAAGAGFDDEQVNAELSQLYAAPGGLTFMGKELRSPLLRESLYEASHRSLLQVYKLGKGDDAVFQSDIDVAAMALGASGLPGAIETSTDRILVDTRVFMGMPFVRWFQSNRAKWDILNGVQQRLKASLMLQESSAWIRALQYASGLRSQQGQVFGLAGTTATSNNAPVSVPTSTAGRISVDQVAIAVARFGGRLVKGQKKLYVHPNRQSDFTLYNFGGVGTGGNGYFSPNTMEMLLAKNNTGTWLGCEVYEDIVVPYDIELQIDSKDSNQGTEHVMGYVLGPAEYVGLEVIRMDLSIEASKFPQQAADLFVGWSDLGYYIKWVKALQRLTDI